MSERRRFAERSCFRIASWIVLLEVSACQLEESSTVPLVPPKVQAIKIEPREQLLPTYPCSGCHAELPSRPKRRQLVEFHAVRSDDFSHGEDAFWCHQCHSRENIDRLVTAAGRLITFDEGHLICLSCHGDKTEDYRTGVHGLTTGYWLGEKHRRSCTACHDPHNPLYPTIEPEEPPAPVRGTTQHL